MIKYSYFSFCYNKFKYKIEYFITINNNKLHNILKYNNNDDEYIYCIYNKILNYKNNKYKHNIKQIYL
jgi:hypothetical protein